MENPITYPKGFHQWHVCHGLRFVTKRIALVFLSNSGLEV
jgi:hypothetical protein